MGFPKTTESIFMMRRTVTTTLEAGARLNSVTTAKLVVKEKWTSGEMKLIQRTILSGKIKTE